jgi:hypothetical protein
MFGADDPPTLCIWFPVHEGLPINLVVNKICLKQTKFKHVLYELYATLLKEQGKRIINKTQLYQ